MNKKLFLVCNAHLDPVWQWEWEEGAAETLSTFRIAADFCEEYESFIFCHNEALLYKWIEEFDPPLFLRIQELVKKGKWHIMGGWHLQPDCNMPSGESFVRQILSGRNYFYDKFGKLPRVAVNLDPFGHSRGLVQIMKKCGYDGYLITRPGPAFLTLPSNEFIWTGYDGSELTCIKVIGGYNSGKGKAAEKISRILGEDCSDNDIQLCLWGIGNHGGGPSKKDLDDISALIENEKAEGNTIIHSTPEEYLDSVKKHHQLPVFSQSLVPWAPGCYTTQVRIKQKYRLAENTYYLTELMCSHASSEGLMEYPRKELSEAMYDILTVQFHDILPGTSIQPGEEMSLRMLDHALEILSRIKAKAFFALSSGQKKADSDKIPVFVYNPYPYEIKGDFMCEFMLWDQNWKDNEFTMPTVYDENGNPCPTQCEKEHSTLPLDWRKRVVFNTTLKPMSMNRFDCHFHILENGKPKPTAPESPTHLLPKGSDSVLKINKQTGLVDAFERNGKSIISEGAFSLEVYEDNFDPWYMNDTTVGWRNKIGEFKLVSKEETADYLCLFQPIEPVHVIESGDVRTVTEAVFTYEKSFAVVRYTLSQSNEIKLDIRINWNEKQKMVKLNIPTELKDCIALGEQPYGEEELKSDYEENVSQKYITLSDNEDALLIANNGIYGSSFCKEKGNIKLTLLRSPSYCAHPINDRTVMPQDRYTPYIDQGERDFSILICAEKKESILPFAGRKAQEFNMQPMALSFYPTGSGTKPQTPVILKSDRVVFTSYKSAENENGYVIRLFNPTNEKQKATLTYYDESLSVELTEYEIKTILYRNNTLSEIPLTEDLPIGD